MSLFVTAAKAVYLKIPGQSPQKMAQRRVLDLPIRNGDYMHGLIFSSLIVWLVASKAFVASEPKFSQDSTVVAPPNLLVHSAAQFDLCLSSDDISVLETIQITKAKRANNESHHFGLGKILEVGLEDFIGAIGPNNEIKKAVAAILKRIVINTIDRFSAETAIVEIIAYLPMTLYDVPRWHVDTKSSPENFEYHIAITLKGPATLVCQLKDDEAKRNFRLMQNNASYGRFDLPEFERRKLMAELYIDPATIVQCEPRKGIVLVRETTVHAEPKTGAPRLFLLIIPGNKDQVGFSHVGEVR